MHKQLKQAIFAILLLAPSASLAQVSQPPVVPTVTTPTACFNFLYALTTTSPWTIYAPTTSNGCQALGTGTGSGTVTTFSAGNLSPIFTTSVATATTTPALTFALSTAAANTVFGNFTGSPAAPTFTAAPTFSAANLTNFPTFFSSLSGDATSTSTGGATSVVGLSGVPFCTGYTPTNTQVLTYTTASSPNPCYTATTNGAGTIGGTPGTGFYPYTSSSLTLSTGTIDHNVTTAATDTDSQAFAAPSLAATGATPGAVGLAAGTGNIPALAANSAGFAAPASGGTSYLIKLPATMTAGIAHYAAPATADGVNESALTSSAVNLAGADVTGSLPWASLTATGHNIAIPLVCADTSASGTTQTCTTSPSFTPAANDCVIYTTTTANTGAGLTLNVNSLGAKSVAKWLGATTLAANDVLAGEAQLACYNGTVWNLSTIGNAPSGGGTPAYPITITGGTSGGVVYGNDSTHLTVSAAGNANILMKWGGAGAAPGSSSITDNGTTVTTAENIISNGGNLQAQNGGVAKFYAAGTRAVVFSTALWGWSGGADASSSADTSLCRLNAAGTYGVEAASSCTATIAGATGISAAAGFESGGVKFTASGCTSISSTAGGATAGKFTIGAATCTVVITMNGATGLTAANGWSCHANDETTAAGNTGLYFSTNNTTTATLTVPATATASDVIDFSCGAF